MPGGMSAANRNNKFEGQSGSSYRRFFTRQMAKQMGRDEEDALKYELELESIADAMDIEERRTGEAWDLPVESSDD